MDLFVYGTVPLDFGPLGAGEGAKTVTVMVTKKWKSSFVKKQTFLNFLNKVWNEKTSFTIVGHLGMPFENVSWTVKVKLSYCQKSVISPFSKQSIKSENLLYKSCPVWYAIWESLIKSES